MGGAKSADKTEQHLLARSKNTAAVWRAQLTENGVHRGKRRRAQTHAHYSEWASKRARNNTSTKHTHTHAKHILYKLKGGVNTPNALSTPKKTGGNRKTHMAKGWSAMTAAMKGRWSAVPASLSRFLSS